MKIINVEINSEISWTEKQPRIIANENMRNLNRNHLLHEILKHFADASLIKTEY